MGVIFSSLKTKVEVEKFDETCDDKDVDTKWVNQKELDAQLVARFGKDETHLENLHGLAIDSSSLETLGHGGFALVKSASSGKFNSKVAIKIIPLKPKPKEDSESETKEAAEEFTDEKLDVIRREITIWTELSVDKSEFIANLFDSIETPDYLYIICELLKNGTVEDQVQRGSKGLTEPKAKTYFKQMLSGLDFIHKKGIAHRDIKPENLLLNAEGRVAISDFGLATNGNPAREFWGTPKFMAPEQATKLYDPFVSDVWQMGITLYYFIYADFPFKYDLTDGKIRRRRPTTHDKEGIQFPKNKVCSVNCKAMINSLLTENPGKRPRLNEVFNHSWLASGTARTQEKKV